jgi:hypothetical protein
MTVSTRLFREVRDELSKPGASKRTIKVAAILLVVIVMVIVGAWFWSSNYLPSGPSATSDKIAVVECSGNPSRTTAIIAVRNVGSGAVEITAIYIGADVYSYSASASPDKFSATSNQIAPGQTEAFTVTKASGSWSASVVRAKVVTKNGAEASILCGAAAG